MNRARLSMRAAAAPTVWQAPQTPASGTTSVSLRHTARRVARRSAESGKPEGIPASASHSPRGRRLRQESRSLSQTHSARQAGRVNCRRSPHESAVAAVEVATGRSPGAPDHWLFAQPRRAALRSLRRRRRPPPQPPAAAQLLRSGDTALSLRRHRARRFLFDVPCRARYFFASRQAIQMRPNLLGAIG